MVVDELCNLEIYQPVLPELERVSAFLKREDLMSLPDGRYELQDGDGYVNLQTLQGKAPEDAVLESHKKMIDVQVPLTCDETIGYAALSRLAEATYDGERDIAFHRESPDTMLAIRRGMFAIFFPQDAHAPGIAADTLRKAVFKIPVREKENE